MASDQPNVVFVFADQMRASATGYAGDPNAKTPNLDRLAAQSLNLTTAVSGCPVCSPARASLLSGLYPLRHGVFLNDVIMQAKSKTMGEVFADAGYKTGYIGKWHVDHADRHALIPRERRRGFDLWRVEECTHNYNNSEYYTEDGQRRKWDGYDAIAQTHEAVRFIESRAGQPFALVLSWGPPHNPFDMVPERYRAMFDPAKLELRPNIPPGNEAHARKELAGYYAHMAALDDCVGMLREALERSGVADNTILVFWSDHGDMMGSQGQNRKQKPWDESIRVPLLIHHPRQFGTAGRAIDTPINTPDLMPTLAGLCGLEPPAGIQGVNYAPFLRGQAPPPTDAALIACYSPFGEWARKQGGQEYRGIRTVRHTYVRNLAGPWLFYDNVADPYQMTNLIDSPAHADTRAQLEARLAALLESLGDDFEPGQTYIDRWGYKTNPTGTIAIAG